MSSEREEELQGSEDEEEEVEPSGGSPISPTPASPPGPQKCPPSSTSSHSSPPTDPFRRKTRDLPNIYNCHGCGLRFPDKGRRERLQPLRSQWRIVLLCKACLEAVRSANVCAYCLVSFAEAIEASITCRRCSSRVHLDCVPNQRGYLVPSDLDPDSFVCVDCCALPRSPVRKPGDFRGSCTFGVPGVSLEDVVRDAKCAAAKKLASAARAKEKALVKAVAAKRAAELARSALNLVVLAETEPTACSEAAVPDEELTLQLHRSMNGSPRISGNLYPEDSDACTDAKRGRYNANSFSEGSGSGSYSVYGKVEICTEDTLFQTMRVIDARRLNVIGSSEESHHVHIDMQGGTDRNKEGDESGKVHPEINPKMDFFSRMKSYWSCPPAREEQGSCSDMLITSTGDDNSIDSISAPCPGYSGPNAFLSSLQKDEKCNMPDRYMKKYCKRSSRMKERKASGGSASLLVPVSQ